MTQSSAGEKREGRSSADSTTLRQSSLEPLQVFVVVVNVRADAQPAPPARRDDAVPRAQPMRRCVGIDAGALQDDDRGPILFAGRAGHGPAGGPRPLADGSRPLEDAAGDGVKSPLEEQSQAG